MKRPLLIVLALLIVSILGAQTLTRAPQNTARDDSSVAAAPAVVDAAHVDLPAAPAAPAAADAAPVDLPATGVVAAREAEPAESFFVRTANGVIAYDMTNSQPRFTLPRGLRSADGNQYFAAQPHPHASAPATVVTQFDPTSGRALEKFVVQDEWQLSGLSPNGRWLALTRVPSGKEKAAWAGSGAWQTAVQIVDTSTREVAHTLQLDGNFEVETVSADGSALFLVQHLPAAKPDHYVIRLFDLRAQALVAGALRSKTTSDEVMAGYAWQGLATADGRWLLTLYLNTRRSVAFVHALNLRDRFPICVDLPSGNGDFDSLKQYTLTLSPDGYKLYAANAALGVVAHIDISSNAQVVRTERFTPQDYAAPRDAHTQASAHSVIAPDGARLYFTSGWDVWAYDTRAGTVEGPFLSRALIAGLAVSADGKRLYIASEGQPLTMLDTQTGAALPFSQAASVSAR